MKILVLLPFLLFFGCGEPPHGSSLDGWQPPVVRPKPNDRSGLVRTDSPTAVVIKTQPNLTSANVDLIVVSISEQRLRAYSGGIISGGAYIGGKMLKEFKVSTAASGKTYGPGEKPLDSEETHNHSGVFKIKRKEIHHVSGIYGSPMPYALHYFEGHWIHATEPKFERLLGKPASHGCVRLQLENAKWLFHRTPVGTTLMIH